jgi:predicted GTPase
MVRFEGLTQLDSIIAEWLRRNSKKSLSVAVNKCESETLGITMAQVIAYVCMYVSMYVYLHVYLQSIHI